MRSLFSLQKAFTVPIFSEKADKIYENPNRKGKRLQKSIFSGAMLVLGGGKFQKFLFIFHPETWGKMIQFDEHIFQIGLVQPPTSLSVKTISSSSSSSSKNVRFANDCAILSTRPH